VSLFLFVPSLKKLTEFMLYVADDGNKLIVHGGRIRSEFYQTLSGEIFILDLNTNIWTQGRSYVKPRLNPVCTLFNGTFISWGGNTFLPLVVCDIVAITSQQSTHSFLGEIPLL
jgi:hypothetical protein